MNLSKPFVASGVAGLLLAGAIVGQTIFGVAFAAGPTPTTSSEPAATAAEATTPDTDAIQSGDQTESQVEDTSGGPDVATPGSAAAVEDAPEAASSTSGAQTTSAP